MPIVDLAPPSLDTPIGVPDKFWVTPGAEDLTHGSDAPTERLPASFDDNVYAAFRQNNSIASYFSQEKIDPKVEDGFSLSAALKGTKYAKQPDAFVDVNSTAAFEAKKRQIDQEENDRKTLDALPWYQRFPLEAFAGVADWPTLLPAGSVIRTAKGGISVVRSAALVGAAAGVSSAAQEAALHATQENRTALESVFNIGGSVILGGLLGAGGSKLLSNAEYRAAATRIEHGLAGHDGGASQAAVYLDIKDKLVAAGMNEAEAETNAAAVAARYATRAERLGLGADKAMDLYKGENIDVRGGGGPVDGPTVSEDALQQAIKAYHGSPHDFERFDSTKIGTGEGAQAYGHGLYFAENPGVAGNYKEGLRRYTVDGVPINELPPGERRTVAGLLAEGESPAVLRRRATLDLEAMTRLGHAEARTKAEKTLAALDEFEGRKFEKPPGRMYEVEINADPAHFLDWDKPLSAQSPEVKRALEKFGFKKPSKEELYQEAKAAGWTDEAALSSAEREFARHQARDPTGGEIYESSKIVPGNYANSVEAAQKLREAGVRGIRYLDQGSRDAGKGSHNYVLFDDNLVSIVRKYAQDARGQITLRDGKAVIDLFTKADASTFMHEAGHLWLTELVTDASKNAGVKSDLDTVLKWLDVDDASKIGRAEQEKWATAFERYLGEGKAPSKGLAKVFADFKDWLFKIYKSLDAISAPIPDDIRGVMDRLIATDREIAARDAGFGDGSMGAAANTAPELAANSIAGRAAGAVAKATRRLNPALRLMQSQSPVVRSIGENLFEFSAYLKKNGWGDASSVAAETLMKEWNGGLATAVKATQKAYADYRMSGAGANMTRLEFNEAVGKAMRKSDTDANPFVDRVAKEWRKSVFDPLKEAAIAAKLLPEDVSVETAASYFSRMWNRNRLNAKEAEFKDIVTRYYAGAIAKEYEKSRQLQVSRMSRADQEIADIQMPAGDRAKLLETLPAELKTLRENNAIHEDTSRSVGEFLSKAAEARAKGDAPSAAAMTARATELAQQAGKDYATYVTARNALAGRIRTVRNNIIGRQGQVEQLRARLADTEAGNSDRLWRLHKSLTLLDKKMQDASPEEWAADLSKAKTDFAKILERSEKAQERLTAAKEKSRAASEKAGASPAQAPNVFNQSPKKPANAWQFVLGMGGVQDPTGELKASGLHKRVIGLVRKNGGRHPDKVREALAEAGYFHEFGTNEEAVAKTTLGDFYDLMARGKDAFAREDQAAAEAFAKGPEAEQLAKVEASTRAAIEAHISEFGLTADPALIERAAAIAMHDGADIESAFERASLEAGDSSLPEAAHAIVAEELPGFGTDEIHGGPVSEGRGGAGQGAGGDAGRAAGDRGNPAAVSGARQDGGPDHALGAKEDAFDAAERRNIEQLNRAAEEIDRLEAIDPEEAVRALQDLVVKRLDQTAALVEDATKRMVSMAERLAKADPKHLDTRLEALRRMKAESERRFFDRWEVKNLGQGVDPASAARPDFTDAARSIADSVFETLTARNESGARPEFMKITSRGPMKDRTFNVPDELIKDFLEHDVEMVGRRYTRVMGPDVELARKFGTPDMTEALGRITADYAKLRQGVTDEKKLLALADAEKADKRDIEGLRDILRGTYQPHPWEKNYANIARSANHLNYIRSMGEVVLASLTDPVRIAMVHGLTPFLGSVAGLATNLKAIKFAVGEAQLAGNVTEGVLGHRLASISDLTDPYSPKGPVEAFLANMSNVASKWNGIRIWTDGMKSITAVLVQNRILKAVTNFASAKPSERAYLAFLGIDQPMAERIAEQFRLHGETVDGVAVANTLKWADADPVAVRAYRAAMNKDMDSTIVQKGVADVPLFANTATGKMLFQFKSFNLASHQKMLLRGLQESQARFIGGVIAMTTMGMAMAYLKNISGNRESRSVDFMANPGWWIAEGLDRSGILSVPMELANTMEKATGFNPVKTPIKAFDKGSAISQKNQNRNLLGAILGPSAGMIEDIGNVAGIPRQLKQGKDITPGEKGAMERLAPFNSYPGLRQVLRYVVNPPAN